MAVMFHNGSVPLHGFLLLLLFIFSSLSDNRAQFGQPIAVGGITKSGGLLAKVVVIIVLLLYFFKYVGTCGPKVWLRLLPSQILGIVHSIEAGVGVMSLSVGSQKCWFGDFFLRGIRDAVLFLFDSPNGSGDFLGGVIAHRVVKILSWRVLCGQIRGFYLLGFGILKGSVVMLLI